jgi:hypothetical protein
MFLVYYTRLATVTAASVCRNMQLGAVARTDVMQKLHASAVVLPRVVWLPPPAGPILIYVFQIFISAIRPIIFWVIWSTYILKFPFIKAVLLRQEIQASTIAYTSYSRAEPFPLSVCLKILQTMNKHSPLTLIPEYP